MLGGLPFAPKPRIEVCFDGDKVKPGDAMCFAGHPERPLRFKGCGHGSDVVATWVTPLSGRPHDVIARQKDVRLLVEAP